MAKGWARPGHLRAADGTCEPQGQSNSPGAGQEALPLPWARSPHSPRGWGPPAIPGHPHTTAWLSESERYCGDSELFHESQGRREETCHLLGNLRPREGSLLSGSPRGSRVQEPMAGAPCPRGFLPVALLWPLGPAAPCQLQSPGCRSPFLGLPSTSTVTGTPGSAVGDPRPGAARAPLRGPSFLLRTAPPGRTRSACFLVRPSAHWPTSPRALLPPAGPGGPTTRRGHQNPCLEQPGPAPAGEDVYVTPSRWAAAPPSPPVVHTASLRARP